MKFRLMVRGVRAIDYSDLHPVPAKSHDSIVRFLNTLVSFNFANYIWLIITKQFSQPSSSEVVEVIISQ